MIDALYKRKEIKDFLDRYSPKQTERVIVNLAEIGVRYLRKNWNLDTFTFDELKEIRGMANVFNLHNRRS